MKDKKKKILKIIQVVYDIISALFIVFVCVAMAIAPKRDNSHSEVKVNDTTQVENPNRHNYGYIDEYGTQITFYESDFLSSIFFEVFLSNVASTAPKLWPTSLDAYFVNMQCDGTLHAFAGPAGSTGSQFASVTDLKISKTATSEYTYEGNDLLKVFYTIALYENSNVVYSYEYEYISPILDINEHDLGSGVIRSNYDLHSHTRFYVYRENDLDGFCPIINYYVKPIIQGRVDRYNEGYQTGYNRGYAVGQEIGDNAGYQRGFVDGAEGIETNAFTTMTQAFEAVGGIFSINVLPNLPLWVLVFAPLIVAVVIVIVKLIKG